MKTINEVRVAIAGMGEMGTGLAEQLRKSGNYVVTEVRRDDDLTVLEEQSIFLAAMTPQDWGAVVDEETGKRASEQIAEHVNKSGVFTWIMAGIEVRRMREDIGEGVAFVRAMPTLTVDGLSQTALYAEQGALTAEQKEEIESFYFQFGEYTWLDSEDQFSRYTLFAASMIALLTDYLETYKSDAVEAGFSEELSEKILAGALRSAAHLSSRGYTLRRIRDKVTTEGGMTEAVIHASRRRNALRKLTRSMVRAGIKRSRELAKS